MQSRKITKYMAERIALALVKDTLAERTNASEALGHELAEKVYLSKLPKAQREMVAALPAHYFALGRSIMVNANGRSIYIELADVRPFPNHLSRRIDLTGKLADDVQAWAEAQETLRNERRTLLSKVETAVLQVGTTKRLHETWPEAAAHLPASDAPLPAVQIDAVRAELANAA